MNFQEFCSMLAKTQTSSVLEDMYIFNKEISKPIETIISALWILKLILLFLIPMNGVILYRTIENSISIPHVSSFIIGITFYIGIMLIQDIISEDTLLSELIENVVSCISMMVVFIYFI